VAMAAAALPAGASAWKLQHGGGWLHRTTGDGWHGELWQGLPRGQGTYIFQDSGLKISGTISGNQSDSLSFSGWGSMEWPGVRSCASRPPCCASARDVIDMLRAAPLHAT